MATAFLTGVTEAIKVDDINRFCVSPDGDRFNVTAGTPCHAGVLLSVHNTHDEAIEAMKDWVSKVGSSVNDAKPKGVIKA